MERNGVVRGTRDARFPQLSRDLVAVRRADDVHVVDVPGLVARQLDGFAETELRVPRSRLAPRRIPARDVREEDPQGGSLDGIEAGVRPHELERDLVARAVEA